jgi:hypothetical protein
VWEDIYLSREHPQYQQPEALNSDEEVLYHHFYLHLESALLSQSITLHHHTPSCSITILPHHIPSCSITMLHHHFIIIYIIMSIFPFIMPYHQLLIWLSVL